MKDIKYIKLRFDVCDLHVLKLVENLNFLIILLNVIQFLKVYRWINLQSIRSTMIFLFCL